MSEISEILKLVKKDIISFIGLIIVVGFITLGIIAPYILTRPNDAWGNTYDVTKAYLPPSLSHPFGTDEYGRDMFNRVLLGTRFSLIIATGVVGVALLIGILIGLIAGYAGGRIATLLMRITDMFFAFPPLLLAIALAATLGRGLINVIIALAIAWWPWYARLVFIQVNSIKTLPFIDGAKVIGLSNTRIMFKYILPNSLTPVTVQASLDMGSAVLEAAALSFLGIGVPPPIPEWGLLISQGWQSINRAWWISIFPGLALVIIVIGFNLLSDAIREIMDPKLKRLLIIKGI
ncbi:MAG: ABC transporter permease [Thermoproteota archaeon]|jgi:peptide/nickel transport system permease protein|nr:ABC transporter permease [Thermoproteota archaeon]